MLDDPNQAVADGTFTLVQIHTGDDGLPTWGGRQGFYAVTGTPTAVFDGSLWEVGAGSNQGAYTAYLSRYNQRRAVPTDVTITATGAAAVAAHTFNICARICLEPGGTAKTVRVYMVQLLDHYGCSYCRYTFMQAASAQDVNLQPGDCQVVIKAFTFNDTSWNNQTNAKIVIWAQEPQASGPPTNPAEVFQAHTLHWPFPGPDCNCNGIPDPDDIAGGTSQDCNANGIPDECDIWNSTSDDENSNGVPDECEIFTGDTNCDGTINFGDINPFVLMLTATWTWHQNYPDCLLLNGDINHDGTVNFGDINPFVALLTGH
jgi:hypothetical protein